MIEINLLPGSGKKSRGRAAGAGFSAALAGAFARVKDPYLLGAVAAPLVALSIVGLLWFTQQQREKSLIQKEQKAVQDSTRYATVVAEKRKAEAQRDSVLRQVNIIKAVDEERFIWSHIMDEVSRALPAYTWITAVGQTSKAVSLAAAPEPSAAPAPTAAAPGAAPAADTAKKAAEAGIDTVIAKPTLTFTIKGNTVDIQALTRFMRFLETSPFIANVALFKTTPTVVEGNQVTAFELTADYELPDPAAVRRVPFTLSGR